MVHGQRIENFVGISGSRGEFELVQAVGNKQDAVDEGTVSRSLDFKVAEKRVGPEKVEDLVNDVVLVVGWVCRAAELGADWENGKVADSTAIRAVRNKCGMVGLN